MKTTVWKPDLPPSRQYKKEVFKKVIETGQFIYQIGESPLLRQKSTEVPLDTIQSSVMKEKILYLKECLRKYRAITGVGRGMSAVQVGIPERFSVIHRSKGEGGVLVIINPHITKTADTYLRYPEMCMSANPLIAPTVRPSWIEFEYFDEEGEMHVWTTKDGNQKNRMYNRIFQHEFDHMEGVVNVDIVLSRELIVDSDPLYYEKAQFEEVTI